MKQQPLIVNERPKAIGLKLARAEWICDTCGATLMDPLYKGCRGLEARNWTIVHFSNWSLPEKWETRRYCPKCGNAAIALLPKLDSD